MAPRLDPHRLETAFRVAAGPAERGEVPCAALAVGRAGGVVRVEAFGPRDGPIISTGLRFPIASITKPISATAVLGLVEEGEIGLDDPVARHLPEFRPPAAGPGEPGSEKVTIWHLLTHTSGVVDDPWGPDAAHRPDAAGLFASACGRPLAFAPGTRYEYASDSFFLLAEIVRRLRGAPFADALRDRIFEPLGMTATSFDPREPAHNPGERAQPSVPLYMGMTPQTLDSPDARWFVALAHPGGGLWSTAPDLLRFGRAMLRGGELDGARVLGRPFVELMTREHTTGIFEAGIPPRAPSYGLGWGKSGLGGRMPGSAAVFDHGGATGTRLWIDPAADLVVVYLANDWGADERHARTAIAAVYGALED